MSGILALRGGGGGAVVLNISNTINPNISSLLTAANWNGISPVRLEVDASALVNTLVIPAISFPNGIYLFVGVGALIGGLQGRSGSGQPKTGGHAITTNGVAISIENWGAIKGGGGLGGRGGDASGNWTEYGAPVTVNGTGGDGGFGQGFVAGTLTIATAQNGWNGGYESGSGGWAAGGSGGRGGNWRQAGASGGGGTNGGSGLEGGSTSAGEAGYAAGLNVNGVASVTWVRQGDA